MKWSRPQSHEVQRFAQTLKEKPFHPDSYSLKLWLKLPVFKKKKLLSIFKESCYYSLVSSDFPNFSTFSPDELLNR